MVAEAGRALIEAVVRVAPRARLERDLRAAMGRVWRRQGRAFPALRVARAAAERYGSHAVSEVAQPRSNDPLLNMVAEAWPDEEPAIARILSLHGRRAATAAVNLTLARIGYPRAESLLPAVSDWIAQHALERAEGIEQVSMERIRNRIAEGLRAGKDARAIARDIREEFDGWARSSARGKLTGDERAIVRRAEVVARTEVAEGWEQASYQTLLANGWSARVWIHSEDERVDDGGVSGPCIDNAAAGPVPIADPFPSGVMWPPQHPNCLVGDTRVVVPGDVPERLALGVPTTSLLRYGSRLPTAALAEAGGHAIGVRASTGRDYVGDVVTIELDNGYFLTGTPNHPIATPHGWVALSDLVLGSDVLTSASFKRAVSGDPDVEHVPPMIQEVAESLPVTLGAMPTAPEDFHGDGAGSDVHVVRTNGLFDRDGLPHLDQHLLHDFVSGADVATPRLVRLGNPEPAIEGLRGAPDGRMGGRGEAAPFLGGSARHAGVHGGASVASRDAEVEEKSANGSAADVEGFCERLLALSSDISVSKVARVVRSPFSGHVYNLETPTGWYIGNGIVTHNCRCTTVPFFGDLESEQG